MTTTEITTVIQIRADHGRFTAYDDGVTPLRTFDTYEEACDWRWFVQHPGKLHGPFTSELIDPVIPAESPATDAELAAYDARIDAYNAERQARIDASMAEAAAYWAGSISAKGPRADITR